MLQRIIGDDISVGIRLDPALAAVEADRAQIERVILNLAANARDAMPNGGVLTIETANVDVDEAQVTTHADGAPGPHVLLAVSDTGVGMDEDVAKHLFEPFFTTKPAGAGTGLGLATVFGVVKQSGGGIYVYSRARPRQHVQDLPAGGQRAAPSRARAGRGPRGPSAGSETIMVVEDDEGVRELVRLMLEANGYEVLTVGDAEEAARLCTGARHRPAADRRRDARGQRQRAGGAARRARARHADPVHVGLLRRGRRPPRRAERGRRVPREAVHREGARAQGARGAGRR